MSATPMPGRSTAQNVASQAQRAAPGLRGGSRPGLGPIAGATPPPSAPLTRPGAIVTGILPYNRLRLDGHLASSTGVDDLTGLTQGISIGDLAWWSPDSSYMRVLEDGLYVVSAQLTSFANPAIPGTPYEYAHLMMSSTGTDTSGPMVYNPADVSWNANVTMTVPMFPSTGGAPQAVAFSYRGKAAVELFLTVFADRII